MDTKRNTTFTNCAVFCLIQIHRLYQLRNFLSENKAQRIGPFPRQMHVAQTIDRGRCLGKCMKCLTQILQILCASWKIFLNILIQEMILSLNYKQKSQLILVVGF